MLSYLIVLLISFIFGDVNSIAMLDKTAYLINTDSESAIADYINAKGYLPKETELPLSKIVKKADTDATYLLSKLSDEDLINLLNSQPKKSEYALKDIFKIRDPKSRQDENFDNNGKRGYFNKIFDSNHGKTRISSPIFRLENKEINPFVLNNNAEPKYTAIQKLHNLLYSHPQTQDDKNMDDDEKKELIFDVLVAQLKTLCCKTNKFNHRRGPKKSNQYKSLLNEFFPQETVTKNITPYESISNSGTVSNEYIFLIVNEEINTHGSEELIYVDPESLERNSSVLLLGPITNQMPDAQLKLVMSRISDELSKPDYLPLFYQLSDGKLKEPNIKLIDSLITGPDTRRYIKPHRCNHQSKLSKIYGGPKWLICTGYLNVNTPSLYD